MGKVVVKGDAMTLTMGNKSMEVYVQVDESKKLKEIDMTETTTASRRRIWNLPARPRYLQDLQIAPAMDRPTEFGLESRREMAAVIPCLKRQKDQVIRRAAGAKPAGASVA